MEAGTSGNNSYEGRNGGELSQTKLEIKIKTLDSHVYTCQVDQNMSIPALKEQIALLTGVPVENQRLIYRGKVLKDAHLLSAYGVEDGHTLHLVTRHAPVSNAPSSTGISRNEAASEDEGHRDLHPGASSNRPGQVSHSIMLGTFNIPDHGDGGMTEVGRIIGSVLNSIGLSNLVPVTGGASSSGSVTATVLPGGNPQQPGSDDQMGLEASDPRPHIGVNFRHPPISLEEPLFDSVHGLRPGGGFISAIPSAVPQIRVGQQATVVPDALTTLSQYLNRLEQVFGSNDQQPSSTVPSLSTQTQSPAVSVNTEEQASVRGYPTPAALGTIVRRAQELLSNWAMPELATLASWLENEPSLHDVVTRGEVQSAALRDGTMMQHLGALLLELGRSTLTLQMGSSPTESSINTGPAMFISALGPNPMMVQPLPFLPSTGVGALTPQPSIAAMSPPVGPSEAPRNVNIHIHAGDVGLRSIFSAVPQASPVTSEPGNGGSHPSQGQNSNASNTTASGSNISTMQAIPGSIQGGSVRSGEQGAARILPVRTLVAAVPTVLHNHPLLARFQQLNPVQLSLPATSVRGGSVEQPALPGTAAASQQQAFVSVPMALAQLQLQAWAPSGGQVGDEQAVLRPENMECIVQLPSVSLASEGASLVPREGQCQSARIGIVGVATSNGLHSATGLVEHGRQAAEGMVLGTDVVSLGETSMQQAVETCQQSGARRGDWLQSEQLPAGNKHAIQVDSVNVTVREDSQKPDQAVGLKLNTQDVVDTDQSKQRSVKNKGVGYSEGSGIQPLTALAASSSSGELPKEGDNSKLQKNGVANVPVGLGLGALQPLPSRVQKRCHKQSPQQLAVETRNYGEEAVEQATEIVGSGGEEVATLNTGKNSLHDSSSFLSSPLEDRAAVGATGQIPERLAQLFNRVGSSGHTLGGQNHNVGEVISQLMATQSLGNISQPAVGATTQGASLSSTSLGSMMGQVMQSPFMGNVLQQIMEQMGTEPHVFDNMLNGQGGFDLPGMLQHMMPIVSQAFSRVTGGISQLAANPTAETEPRCQEVTGVTQNARSINTSDAQNHPQNKDELPEQNGTNYTDADQETLTQRQMSSSEGCSGGSPDNKRQKTQ